MSNDFDLALAAELKENFFWLSVATLLLAIAGSYPLSYWLVKRTRSLTRATREIAAGDLSTRIHDPIKDEIGELAHHLNDLTLKLESNETARKRWIADISHELRTPVAIASGELEAMLDGIRELTPDNLQSAKQEIARLTRLFEDLYLLSNLDIGSLSYHKCYAHLDELAEHCVTKRIAEALKAGLSLNIDASSSVPEVWVDPDRMTQLIDNLITNAIKYTHAPGDVHVRVGHSSKHVTLVIEDSAPGVASQELERLFDPLYRVETSRNRRTGGAGLGLGICKAIAKAHDGTLVAEPSTVGGLKVSLTLPLSQDEQAQ